MANISDDTFDKLKKIAKEEFGVEVVKGDKPMTFKTVFGFDVEDLKELKEE